MGSTGQGNPVTTITTVTSAVVAQRVVLPPVAGRFSYQLSGAYRPAAGVVIVDRDRQDPPVPGMYSICYINAFQAQPDEITWWGQHHPDLLLHDREEHLVIDQQWHEPLLGVDSAAHRAALISIQGGWIDQCASAGFQAIEPDNLDSYTRSENLLTSADALAYGQLLVARAHRDRLAIAQKNADDLSSRAHADGFDFAMAEECQIYVECGSYSAVYGRHVIEVEYSDQPARAFSTACLQRGTLISIVRRDRDLVAPGQPGHVEQWCPGG
jgi:hypothetical protein